MATATTTVAHRLLLRGDPEYVVRHFAADLGVATNHIREAGTSHTIEIPAPERVLVPEAITIAQSRELIDQDGMGERTDLRLRK